MPIASRRELSCRKILDSASSRNRTNATQRWRCRTANIETWRQFIHMMEISYAGVVEAKCARSHRRCKCCVVREESIRRAACAESRRHRGAQRHRVRRGCRSCHRQGSCLSRALSDADTYRDDRYRDEDGNHRAAAGAEAIRKRGPSAAILCKQQHSDARPLPDLERMGSTMDQEHEQRRARKILRFLYRGSGCPLCRQAALLGCRQRAVLARAQGARRLPARSMVRHVRHGLRAPRLRARGDGRPQDQTGSQRSTERAR